MCIIHFSKTDSTKISSRWISVLDKRPKSASVDELNEVTHLEKCYSLYDQKISKFVSSDLMKQAAEEQYNDTMQPLPRNQNGRIK